MSEPLLLRAAPGRSADLFHAVPLDIIDPFLYIEVDDRRFAVNSVLERDRIEALGLGIELIDPFELGLDELLDVPRSSPTARSPPSATTRARGRSRAARSSSSTSGRATRPRAAGRT
jgi:hypothetical protein